MRTYTNEFLIRFRLAPMFGQGTIHQFANNASEMKEMAMQNFENSLQV